MVEWDDVAKAIGAHMQFLPEGGVNRSRVSTRKEVHIMTTKDVKFASDVREHHSSKPYFRRHCGRQSQFQRMSRLLGRYSGCVMGQYPRVRVWRGAMLCQSSCLETSCFVPTNGQLEFDDEAAGLRYRLLRLRLALRFTNEPHVEAILRDVIEQIEKRLEQLGQ
jgi:hypothetical protein